MSRPTKAVLLSSLLAVLPLVANAQTCQPGSIPATTPTSQFTDNSDGTVTDNKTGLMWKKCAEGQDMLTCSGSSMNFNWQAALQHAQDMNGGTTGNNLAYNDWRVPNIKELASIMEEQCYYPAINAAVFPNTPTVWFWSASSDASSGYRARGIDFYRGNGNVLGYKDYGGSVRLVRSESDHGNGQ